MRKRQASFSQSVVSITVLIVLSCTGITAVSSVEPEVAVSPNPVSVTADQAVASVRVTWSGLVPRQLVFIDLCKKSISDASFDAALDCGQFSGITPNGSSSGAGTAEFEVFRGQDPAGELWGCYAAGDTAPQGVEKFTRCFIRATDTIISNSENDSETPIAFEGAPRVDPGSPTPGAGVAGAAGSGPGLETAENSELLEALQVADSASVDGRVAVDGVAITG